MTVLVVDGYNLLHRARSGFKEGSFPIVFNFFRGFRALVEQFEPTRIIFATEGKPKQRLAEFAEYKANRVVEEGTEKHAELVSFHRQKDLILDLLTKHFPVSVVRHPDHEADDTIYNIIRKSPSTTEFIVVSSDSDYTQLLNNFDNVKVYNPVKKAYVEWDKEVDYVVFKALKGDTSDNIPGVKGIGEKKAMKLARHDAIVEYGRLGLEDEAVGQQLIRNERLIRFIPWTDEEAMAMTSSQPTKNWDEVKAKFTEWEFASIVKDKSWTKFINTFDSLFGT